jgi:hypothetical protein
MVANALAECQMNPPGTAGFVTVRGVCYSRLPSRSFMLESPANLDIALRPMISGNCGDYRGRFPQLWKKMWKSPHFLG